MIVVANVVSGHYCANGLIPHQKLWMHILRTSLLIFIRLSALSSVILFILSFNISLYIIVLVVFSSQNHCLRQPPVELMIIPIALLVRSRPVLLVVNRLECSPINFISSTIYYSG